jgi:hypothetical protein
MPITISQDTERLTYEHDGSQIFYKRISKTRLNFIQKKHTKRGVVDWGAVSDEVFREAILGWKNVQSNGKSVPFSVELIPHLPIVVHNDLIDCIMGEGAYEGREESPEKNSKASSPGS